MWTGAFWKDAAERAVSTAAQSVLAVVGVDVLAPNAFDLDYKILLGIAAGGALLSLLKALAANAKNPATGASFGTAVPGDLVAAQSDPAGDKIGELVAGPALRGVKDGTPVDVAPNQPGNWAV